MPRAMHSYYLRNMYLENNLVKPDYLEILGQGIDLGRVRVPCYVVAGLGDHIVPWRSAHRAANLFSGGTRCILAYGGHITSIINPPASRRGFYYTMDLRSNAARMDNADEWLKTAARNQDSWWPDWVHWLSKRSGKKITPPPLGLERGSDKRYAPIVAAPGTYVLEE